MHAGGFTADFGDRMSSVIEATSMPPGGRRLLRARAEPVPRQRARFASIRRRARASGWSRPGAATSTRSRTSSTRPRRAELLRRASAALDYEFSPRHARQPARAAVERPRRSARTRTRPRSSAADYRNTYVWGTLEHDFSPQLRATRDRFVHRRLDRARPARSTTDGNRRAPSTTSDTTTCSA